METEEKEYVTNCCNAKTCYVPSCFGDSAMYFCSKCNKEIGVDDVHLITTVTHIKIAKGIYRPIKNN